MGTEYRGVIKELIQNEIDWCLENPSEHVTELQRKFFIRGLRQAIYLIEQAEEALEEDYAQ
jgi:hypothetical protein